MSLFLDPTPAIEPEVPGTYGSALAAGNHASTISVSYLGETITCRVAGEAIAIGGPVNVVTVAGIHWAIKHDAGYPSHRSAPLSSWSNKAPASLAIRYLMDGNPRTYRYAMADVTAVSTAVGTAPTMATCVLMGVLMLLPVMCSGASANADVGVALAFNGGAGAWQIVGNPVPDPTTPYHYTVFQSVSRPSETHRVIHTGGINYYDQTMGVGVTFYTSGGVNYFSAMMRAPIDFDVVVAQRMTINRCVLPDRIPSLLPDGMLVTSDLSGAALSRLLIVAGGVTTPYDLSIIDAGKTIRFPTTCPRQYLSSSYALVAPSTYDVVFALTDLVQSIDYWGLR